MGGGLSLPSLAEDHSARILWIRDYIRTYVLPLVIEQFNIRETMAFEQAARLVMLQSGQFLNVSRLSQMAGVSQPTAMNFMQYLEAMMVVQHVPVFFRKSTKRLIKHPKIYVSDPALMNESLGNHFSLQKASEKKELGAIYETFIFNEIQKTLSNHDLLAESFAWRTQDEAEVDIVLSTAGKIIPIEVKWTKRLTKRDASGLLSFLSDYSEVDFGFIAYPGEHIQQVTEKVIAIPDWWLLGC